MDWRQNCSNQVCPWSQTCLNQHCFLWGKNNFVLPQTFTTCRQNGLVNTQQNILDFLIFFWLALISFSLPKLSTWQQVVAEWIFQGNSVKCYDMMTQSLDLLIVCCVLNDWTSSLEHDIFQNVSAGNLKSKLSKKLSFCGGIAHVIFSVLKTLVMCSQCLELVVLQHKWVTSGVWSASRARYSPSGRTQRQVHLRPHGGDEESQVWCQVGTKMQCHVQDEECQVCCMVFGKWQGCRCGSHCWDKETMVSSKILHLAFRTKWWKKSNMLSA